MSIYLFSSFSIPPLLFLVFLFSPSASPLPFSLSGLVNCCCVQYWSNSSEKNVTIAIHFCGNVNNDDLNPSSFPPSLSPSLLLLLPFTHHQVVLLINATVQFGNVLLLSSYLMFTLLSSLVSFHCTCNDDNNNYYY